jgi:membrane-associated PAP2 superfamily phosphatase
MRGTIREAVVALALGVLATVIFRLYPVLDLKLSALFYAGPGGFWLQGNPMFRKVRDVGEAIPLIATIVLSGLLLLKLARPRWRPVPPKAVLFLLLTLALGPGLTTNLLLKDHWGRPRPVEIVEFGGTAEYVKPWTISKQCAKNCSFVSGEASSAFWLMALSPLLPGIAGALALGGGILAGLFFGAARVTFGGHFLSDVVFAGFVTFAVVWAVYVWLYRLRPAWAEEAALEARFARWHGAIRDLARRLCGKAKTAPARDLAATPEGLP